MVNAQTLHRKTREYGVPIVVRMSRDAGLATLMKDDCNALDKESNRHQAAHVEVKLKAIACGIQPLQDV